MDKKLEYKIREDMWSCHTALIDGYVIEGHVPASDIKKLLALGDKNVLGLAVPNMPIGSPGMEQGDLKEPYNTYILFHDGNAKIFAKH